MLALKKLNSQRVLIAALLFAALAFLFIPFKASAQIDGANPECPEHTTKINGLCVPDQPQGQGGFTTADTVPELALKVLAFLLTLAGVIAVFFIIIGGYWYLTAAGNDEQAEKGKKALIQSVIGLIVIVLAYTFVRLIINTVTQDTVF